jgi:hypothetical protein
VSGDQAYGLWPLVLLDSGLFIPAWTRYAVRSPGSCPRPSHRTPGGTPGTSGPTAPTRRQGVGRPTSDLATTLGHRQK